MGIRDQKGRKRSGIDERREQEAVGTIYEFRQGN
jgi:hypothetical protein